MLMCLCCLAITLVSAPQTISLRKQWYMWPQNGFSGQRVLTVFSYNGPIKSTYWKGRDLARWGSSYIYQNNLPSQYIFSMFPFLPPPNKLIQSLQISPHWLRQDGLQWIRCLLAGSRKQGKVCVTLTGLANQEWYESFYLASQHQ